MPTRTRKPRTKPLDLPWIAKDLRSLARPVASLTPDPKNSRKHGPANLARIRASLSAHGQQKAVVVKDGVVLAGNGALETARALGWTHLACVVSRSAAPTTTRAMSRFCSGGGRTAHTTSSKIARSRAYSSSRSLRSPKNTRP